jgi:hypothetical protein
MPRPNALFKVLSQHGTLSFDSTLRRMLDLGVDAALLDELIAALPPAYTNQGLNLPGPALYPMRSSGVGFYTFLYRHMYGGTVGPLHVGRMEQVRTDLLAMLASVGQPLSDTARRYIVTREPSNVSRHAAYPEYYDRSLRALVEQRDAELITRHGYRFGVGGG